MVNILAEQVLALDVEGAPSAATFILLDLLKKKNKAIYMHSQQTANYAVSTAAKMKLPPIEIERIKVAALLHDIGKLAVPNAIFDKFPYLSKIEMSTYKNHCNAGASILENMPEFQNIIPYIRYHHERWDGKGFPKRLKGVNIPLGARIIGVADHYDRYVNPCTSKWQKSTDAGIKEILAHSGTAFDPEVVKAFIKAITNDVSTIKKAKK